MRDEEVVQERCDIVEDGFSIEEELGEKREALRVEFVFFTIDLVQGVVVFCVDVHARRRRVAEWACFLHGVSRQLCIPTHINSKLTKCPINPTNSLLYLKHH